MRRRPQLRKMGFLGRVFSSLRLSLSLSLCLCVSPCVRLVPQGSLRMLFSALFTHTHTHTHTHQEGHEEAGGHQAGAGDNDADDL